jgi:hypothetical protein
VTGPGRKNRDLAIGAVLATAAGLATLGGGLGDSAAWTAAITTRRMIREGFGLNLAGAVAITVVCSLVLGP